MIDRQQKYLALSGGIGGAKLVLGLSHVLAPEQLSVVANTGDDFQHFGLTVCPDIDTLIYTLSGLGNKKLGWGREDESWNFMAACAELGMDTWFRLGDRDLALHLYRTQRLAAGAKLTQITAELCERLGIRVRIIPMSDLPAPTVVFTDRGELSFQEYFVRHRCAPEIHEIEYRGSNAAAISPLFAQSLRDPDLRALIICPSNPFLSVQPILSLPAVKETLRQAGKPVIVVSPIVAGEALKGPTAGIMRQLNMNCDVRAIAEYYADIADGIIIDSKDSDYTDAITATGIRVHSCNIVMQTLEDRIDLAREALRFSEQLRTGRHDR